MEIVEFNNIPLGTFKSFAPECYCYIEEGGEESLFSALRNVRKQRERRPPRVKDEPDLGHD